MDFDELAGYVARTSRLDPPEARRLLEEVVALLASETYEAFAVRRHGELKRAGMKNNDAIFRQIAQEMVGRPFAAPRLSERQLRRLIYG